MPAPSNNAPNHFARKRAAASSAAARPDAGAGSPQQAGDLRDPRTFCRLGGLFWQGLRRWFQENTFAPVWLPKPARHPLVGYLLGILLVGVSIAVDLLILHLFPDFGVPGILAILAILLTALAWGAGPSLVATLASVILFDYFDLAPNLIIARLGAALLADDFLFILVGVAISLIAIQIQRARRNAEALAASLAAERARSDLERQRLQTVLDVLPVGVAIADARGRVLAINDAFQELWGEGPPLPAGIAEYDSYRGWWPDTGELIAAQEWAMARALTSGEVCFGEEVEIETFDGQRKAAINTAAPIRDETGAIIGGVVAVLDITERRTAEQERARLLERERLARAEAERATEQLSNLQIINDAALKHLTLDDLLHALLERTSEALSIENCSILLLDETGQTLTMRAVRGLEAELAQEVRIPLGQGLAGRIAVSREPLIVNDLSTFETIYPYFRERFRSFIGVPLLVNDQVIGVIHMTAAQPNRFTPDDARLLALLASRIALAIDHARLYEAKLRAHAEADARASQLEAIFEALADGLMVYDADGHMLRTNTAVRRILGPGAADLDFTRRSAIERRDLLALRDEHGHLIPEDHLPFRRALRGEALTGDHSVELFVRTLDGQERIINTSSAPIRDAKGQIVGALTAFHDVTERRRLERRTQEALNGLLAIAQTLMQAPEEPSLDGEPMPPAGSTARRLAELTAQILGCERLGIFSYDPEQDALLPVAVAGLAPGWEGPWRFDGISRYAEFFARLQEGKPLVLDTANPPLSDQVNIYQIQAVLAVPMRLREHLVGALFLDYGVEAHMYTPEERSLAEGAALLTALVLERERLLREREEARASALALREANRQMDVFLGVASHELRTPLTSVLLGLQLSQRRCQRLLEDADVTERLSQRLKFLFDQLVLTERQTLRLDRLVNDLLDVSRIRTGRLMMHRQTADLAAIVAEMVEEQRQAAPEHSIHLHLPDQPVLLTIDAERIGQVITNYLTNALKYSAEDQPVEVGLELEAGAARVWVRDQGPGLPPEEQALIWERFHRVPGVEVRSGSGVGLGLGLHISRTIIEAHQGQVGVESAPGAGTTFWFRLPLSAPDQQ